MKKELDEEFKEDSEEDDDEEEEEPELEEELEKSEKPTLDLDFNDLDFSQFTPQVTSSNLVDSSPVLENIESRIDRPGFVQMGSFSEFPGSSSNSRGGRDDTYLPSQEDSGGGPKYLQPGGEETNIKRIDVQKIGRDVGNFPVLEQGNFFASSRPDFQSGNAEHVGMQPERIDTQDVGRKNPLEIEEIKYEEHKKYEFDPSK